MDYVSLLEYKIKSELRDCIGYLEGSHDLVLVENTDGLSLYLDHLCLCGDLPKTLVPQECWGAGTHQISPHQTANIIFPIPSAVLMVYFAVKYTFKDDIIGVFGVKEQESVEQRLSTVRNIIDAIQFAKNIHKAQVDLAKQPYINHPLRVAGRVLVANGGVNGDLQEVEHVIITALLHDTVEDAEKHIDVVTVIKNIGGWTCLRAVKCLTKEEDETYETYIERVSRNDLATAVKMADLQDNLDPSRALKETPGSLKRREKYEKALNFLKNKIKV